MIDLDAMEKMARIATPGEWDVQFGLDVYPTDDAYLIDGREIAQCQMRGDAAFIAHMNPARVLEMVTRMRKLEDLRVPLSKLMCQLAHMKDTPDTWEHAFYHEALKAVAALDSDQRKDGGT